MSDRAAEVERKFVGVAPEPAFGGLVDVGQATAFTMVATYWDTPGHALAAAGWSLRRREGGHDDGWHLKRPRTAGAGRIEVAAPLAAELPAALREEAGTVIGTAPLVPVAEITTHRRESALLRAGRVAAHLACDEVTVRVGAAGEAWSEAEVELEPGTDEGLLDALTGALLAEGAQLAPHGSRVARALDRLGTPRAALGPGSSAGDVLLDYAGRQVGMLQAQAGGVRIDAPDAVHKARVATRRLRSLLKTFTGFWETARTEPLRAELGWLAGLLGAPRDAEVLAEEFGDLFAELGSVADSGVRQRVLAHLADAHATSHAELVAALDGPRGVALRGELVRLLVEPPLAERADEPAASLLEAVDRAERRAEKLVARAERKPGKLARWHEVRKAGKAVRYCAEAVAPVHPELAERAAAWEEVGETLGALQDAAVADELLADLEQGGPPSATWGVLRAIQSDRHTASLTAGRAALAAALE